MTNELTHRAFIDVYIAPVSGFHTPYESEMEFYLAQLLERIIDVKNFSRNQVFSTRFSLSIFGCSSLTFIGISV